MTTRLRYGVGVGLAVLAVVGLSAQTRDGTVPAPGSVVITGTVLTDDVPPRPLGRAIVTVTGSALPASRSAITNDEGRFVIRNLPPGRVTIASAKRGHVAGAYGAKRPGRPGTPVQLGAGQNFEATIRMSPAGVLTGLIRDERGDPIPGLRVFAIDAETPVAPGPGTASRAGASGAGVETDDRGIYRIFDLAPGTYLVAATPTTSITGDIRRRSATEVDAVLARLQARSERPGQAAVAPATPVIASTLAVMFFPGTAVMADATRVMLGRGDVRDGLDFVMAPVPVTTIEGVVLGEGPLPASVQMSIVPANTLRFFALSSANPQLSRAPDSDGRFMYTTIVPGRYTILARVSGLPGQGRGIGRAGAAIPIGPRGGGPGGGETPAALYAIETVDVIGQPVSGVTLRLQRGSRFSGRLLFDVAVPPAPSDLSSIRVALQPLNSSSSTVAGTIIGDTFGTSASTAVRADGTFEIAGVAPGRYRVTFNVPPDAYRGWWLRSAVVNNRDVLDSTLENVLGVDQADAVLTLTDRHSELSGTLQTSGGLPAPDYFVIVFPADPQLRQATRRVLSTRPATDGRFNFVDLPAGEYLVVALTDVEPNEWRRTEFLAEIAPAGVKVTLGQGEKKVQDLRISTGTVESTTTVR